MFENEFDALIADLEFGRRARERELAKAARIDPADKREAEPQEKARRERIERERRKALDRLREQWAREARQRDELVKAMESASPAFAQLSRQLGDDDRFVAAQREQARQNGVKVMQKADAALAAGKIKPEEHRHLVAVTDLVFDATKLRDEKARLRAELDKGDLAQWQRDDLRAQIKEVNRRLERCKARHANLLAWRPA